MKINSSLLFSNCLGIFQGGGCKAISYVGAYKAAYEKGIGFSDVGGTSAGAIFAALIAAGATPDQLAEIAYSDEIKAIPKPFPKKGNSIKSILRRAADKWFPVIAILTFVAIFSILFFVSLRDGYKLIFIFLCLEVLFFVLLAFCGSPMANMITKAMFSVYDNWGFFQSENIEKTVESWLHQVIETDKDIITFNDLPRNLIVFSCNLSKSRIMRWSKDDEKTRHESVAKAVAASCSIPIYFSPTKILDKEDRKDYLYADGGMLLNRPDIIYDDYPNYFQALSFKLKSNPSKINRLRDYLGALVNTIIQGADHLWHSRKSKDKSETELDEVNEVEIEVGDVKATDFSKLTKDDVTAMIDKGYQAMSNFLMKSDKKLADEGAGSYTISSNRILKEEDGMDFILNQVAFWSYEKNKEIRIAYDNLDWVWPMFPTIISWIQDKTQIFVYYNENQDSLSESKMQLRHDAQKRLLQSLGVSLIGTKPNILIPGFFIKRNGGYKCILTCSSTEKNSDGVDVTVNKSKIYNSELDSIFISNIINALTDKHTPTPLEDRKFIVKRINENDMIALLHDVTVYQKCASHVDIRYEKKKVKELSFIKRDVRSLKYKELRIIDKLFKDSKVELYAPAELTLYDGKKSTMTPIIAEKHGDKIVVIKGNARCFRRYKEAGPDVEVPIFIVESESLTLKYVDGTHISKFYKVDELILSEKKNRGQSWLVPLRIYDQALRPDDIYLVK